MPRLTQARAPLTRSVAARDAWGRAQTLEIPAERALTLYLDKHELVTLMTLGAQPEWLVLGYLRNQRLIQSRDQVESITVDWDVGAAAVKTVAGVPDLPARTAQRVVTTGCGQGSVFGDLMADLDDLRLPASQLTQAALYGLINAIRVQESTYKSAGSVHGCALFAGERLLIFVEDVGRHNAVDAIAGWMWLQPEPLAGGDKVFYTTGRLTSEMVIKAAQMGVPMLVSRSGITAMGQALAQRLGLCTVVRATHKRFLCTSACERIVWQPELAGPETA